MLRRYLDDLEARIDDAVESRLYNDWVEFAEGRHRRSVFAPTRNVKSVPSLPWPDVKVNESLGDYEKMALQQFRGCSDALTRGSGAILSVRCNYGTGIMPSLWGAEIYEMAEKLNTLPTTRPISGGKDTIKSLLDKGIPDFSAGYGPKVFEMAGYFLSIMAEYPKIKKHVYLYHPDMQGPMDICELLWGSGIFYDLIDEPDLVKALLNLITDTYIAFMGKWDNLVPSDGSYAVHWAMLHKGHIMLRDDSAMNLSPAMFDEFIRPYDQRLLETLGGGAIHFCGRGDHYINSLSEMRGVHAINLSQPEYNDMDIIYNNTVLKGINIIGLDNGWVTREAAQGREFYGRVSI